VGDDAAPGAPELDLARAADILRQAKRIAVFTGAGISAESGIPTFRDAEGLWTRFPPEQFARWNRLEQMIWREPSRVAEFIIALIQPILHAQPNPAHRAIVDLESLGRRVQVITQNIDRLHQRAGSSVVIELHGSIFEVRHDGPAGVQIEQISMDDLGSVVRDLKHLLDTPDTTPTQFLLAATKLIGMTAAGTYRPNLVLFGDLLPFDAWDKAVAALTDCDCLLIVGTSQLVYPAARLPHVARARRAKTVAIGFEECASDVSLCGQAGVVLPRLVSKM
jgi:NAD-dependent deacetylase